MDWYTFLVSMCSLLFQRWHCYSFRFHCSVIVNIICCWFPSLVQCIKGNTCVNFHSNIWNHELWTIFHNVKCLGLSFITSDFWNWAQWSHNSKLFLNIILVSFFITLFSLSKCCIIRLGLDTQAYINIKFFSFTMAQSKGKK